MKRWSCLLLLSAIAPTLLPVSAVARVGVVVGIAPPVPILEPIPPPPAPSYVWQPGYWAWDGVAYVWVPGTYVAPPYIGAVWVPGRWIRRGGGWVWVAGHWRS